MKLFIATPCYGGQLYSGYFKSILSLISDLKDFKINYEIKMIDDDSLVTRARNKLVYHFLKSDSTHLIFIDADITFLSKSILYMLNLKKDIVGGCYPKKQLNLEQIKKTKKEGIEILAETCDYVVHGIKDTKNKNLKEVDYIGTGFLLISKKVFESLDVDSYYDDKKREVKEYFKTGIIKKTYLSEDYYFCKMVRDKGFKIYTDLKIPLNHTGQFTFIGCHNIKSN